MNKVELVIPLGPGDPEQDSPSVVFMEQGFNLVKNQTCPVYLTCAVDKNLSDSKLKIIEKYADKIKIFPEDSYFRPGGIWNKIYTCWEESNAKYVAWNGYDDYFSLDRFECQVKKLEETGANSCFCSNYADKEGVIIKKNDGNINFKGALGNHVFYMMSFLIRKSAILSSGISEYRYKWSASFEKLLYAFIIKTGIPVISGGKSFYRAHTGTISKTAFEDKEWVIDARNNTKYSINNCINDWDSIQFSKIVENIKNNIKEV